MATRRLDALHTARGLAAAASVVLSTLAVPAAAQHLEKPRPRQGYYLGGGLHMAGAAITDGGDSLGLMPGNLLSLRTGEMLTSHLGLGLGLEYGGAALEPMSAAFGGLSLEGQWEFVDNLALHAGTGFGVVGLVDADHPDDPRRGSFGGAYSLGLSYDWFPRSRRLSGGWALQPRATLRYLPDDPVSSVIFSVGLEVMRWRGLKRNELELPPGEGYESTGKPGRDERRRR